MKKIILTALVAVAAISANAQYWVGGEVSLKSNKASKNADAVTSFTFAPEFGYKFNDQWAVGVNLTYKSNATSEFGGDMFGGYGDFDLEDYLDGFDYDDFDYDDEDFSGSSSSKPAYFGLGVFARYNIAKTGIATFFVDGGIGLKFWNNSVGTEFSIGIRPGVSIAASEKVSLVAKVGYIGYQKYSDKRGGGSDIGLGIDNSALSFGVYYNF